MQNRLPSPGRASWGTHIPQKWELAKTENSSHRTGDSMILVLRRQSRNKPVLHERRRVGGRIQETVDFCGICDECDRLGTKLHGVILES